MRFNLIILLIFQTIIGYICCYQINSVITLKSIKLSNKLLHKYQKHEYLLLLDQNDNRDSSLPTTTSSNFHFNFPSIDTNKSIQNYLVVLFLLTSCFEVYINNNPIENVVSGCMYVSSYWRYFLCGAGSCAFSHVITVPFDVIKTRIQVNKQSMLLDNHPVSMNTNSKLDMFTVASNIIEDEGINTLLTGIIPTFIGFSIQGAFKYGFYEVFKPIAKDAILTNFANHINSIDGIIPTSSSLSVELVHTQEVGSIIALVISAASAEFIGTFFLTPFETARIRLVSNSKYATGIIECIQKMIATEGALSLLLGFPAILLKALPYTAFQLVCFELTTSNLYQLLSQAGYSSSEALQYRYVVTVFSAIVAAIISSLASQPGDTLFSLVASKLITPSNNNVYNDNVVNNTDLTNSNNENDMNKNINKDLVTLNPFSIIYQTISEVGLQGLFRGTKARLVHVLFIVVIQLLCYDTVKQLVGIPVTGFH